MMKKSASSRKLTTTGPTVKSSTLATGDTFYFPAASHNYVILPGSGLVTLPASATSAVMNLDTNEITSIDGTEDVLQTTVTVDIQ